MHIQRAGLLMVWAEVLFSGEVHTTTAGLQARQMLKVAAESA
jgi:hypothetical protein